MLHQIAAFKRYAIVLKTGDAGIERSRCDFRFGQAKSRYQRSGAILIGQTVVRGLCVTRPKTQRGNIDHGSIERGTARHYDFDHGLGDTLIDIGAVLWARTSRLNPTPAPTGSPGQTSRHLFPCCRRRGFDGSWPDSDARRNQPRNRPQEIRPRFRHHAILDRVAARNGPVQFVKIDLPEPRTGMRDRYSARRLAATEPRRGGSTSGCDNRIPVAIAPGFAVGFRYP